MLMEIPSRQDHYCTPILNKEEFIKNDTMTDEMYQFLSACFASGLSTCFTGNCGSGKTTAMGSFLKPMSEFQKILIIENECRELNLGSSNVVQWIADDHHPVKDLLLYAVTDKPDVLCLGEIRSDETLSVMDICQMGQFMTTVVHANSCKEMYRRMAALCQRSKPDISCDELYKLCITSFPIGVYLKKMYDGVRRVVQITESYVDAGEPVINLLYKFDISLNESSNTKVAGDFVRINEPSDGLKKRLRAS